MDYVKNIRYKGSWERGSSESLWPFEYTQYKYMETVLIQKGKKRRKYINAVFL